MKLIGVLETWNFYCYGDVKMNILFEIMYFLNNIQNTKISTVMVMLKWIFYLKLCIS